MPSSPQRSVIVINSDENDSRGDNLGLDTEGDSSVLSRVLASIYGTVMLELMVKRNASIIDPGESVWGFGQVVAMVILLAPLNEVVHFVLGLFDSDGKKIKTRELSSALFVLEMLLTNNLDRACGVLGCVGEGESRIYV